MNSETLFRALSDETRLRCLALLFAEGELCVCELTQALDLSQPKVSRHLAALRDAGLVADRRAGLWVHYRLHPELPEWVVAVLSTTFAAVGGQAPFAADRGALRRTVERPEAGAVCRG